MRYDIWELGEGDIRLLRALNALFGTAFGERGAYGDAPPSDAYVESLLFDASFIALVARIGGEVVGGLTAYVLRKFEREASEVYVHDLAVAEAHRRKGVATALMQRLREIAQDRQADLVFVQAGRGDAPAVALYRKLGRGEEVLHFDIDLP